MKEKITKENREEYIKNKDSFIKEKKLSKEDIQEFENSVKGTMTPLKIKTI